jgi:hypothetical protein
MPKSTPMIYKKLASQPKWHALFENANLLKRETISTSFAVPIFWAKRWRWLPSRGTESDSTTIPHLFVDWEKNLFIITPFDLEISGKMEPTC